MCAAGCKIRHGTLLAALQEEMGEKAKQHRVNQLHIKDLYQRLETLEAAVVAAAAHTAQQTPPPPEPAPLPEPELVCKLMLCMVYEQPQCTAVEIAEAAARLAAQEAAQQAAAQQRRQAAATRLQAAARGFLARRRLAVQHAAATTIQAAARGFLVRQALATIWEADEAAEEAAQSAAAAANLSSAQRLALRQREAELHYQRRAAAAKAKPQRRLLARPGSTARGANTAVEAAARRRGLLPTSGESGHGAGTAAVRWASALAILGSGSSSSPSRRLSSLAGLGSCSLRQGPSDLLMGAGTGGPSRAEAGVRQGHAVDRASWTGSAAASGKAARTTTSGTEGGGAGSPSGRFIRHGGRVSMARVPPLDLAHQEGPRQRAGQQAAQAGGQRQAGKQHGEGQQPPPSETQSEDGAQQEDNEGGSPRWQLERSGAPAEALAPASGGQPHRRRESLGFGSSKPRA